MFILTTFADLITLPPSTFTRPTASALEDLINAKYSNKVVPGTGLCIALFDILKCGEGIIHKGSANVNVHFRMIVFRPFKGEVLTGRIASSTQHGIKVRLGAFFDEVFLPPELLFEGCKFDHIEQVWVWYNDGQPFYMDKNEEIRIKVEDEKFVDQTPVPPSIRGDAAAEGEGARTPVYQIIASCQQAGLGLTSWW